MKKSKTLLCVCLVSVSSVAQTIYLKPTVGFGSAIQGQAFNSASSYYYESPDTSYTNYTYASEKYSFGKGMRFGLAAGAALTRNIAVEIAVDYSKGKSPEFIMHANDKYDYDQVYTVEFTDKYNYECKSIQLAPGIMLRSSNLKAAPYLKLGAVIGLASVTENYESALYNSIPSYYPFESWTHCIEYKRTISLGYTAAVGCDMILTEGIYVFAEAKLTSLSWSPKKGEETSYAYRGEDKLATLPYNERNFEYVDSFSDSDNTDADVAGKRISRTFPLSSIAALVGLRIDINLRKTTKTE
jgi:hypothetical protein